MTQTTGERIAIHRRRRGLGQAAVAGLIGRSESWLSQVERGVRGVDSYRVLQDLARVLRVDIAILADPQPTAGSDRGRNADVRLSAVERALLLGTGDASVPDAGTVEAVHADYQAARYDLVLDVLPGLIGGLDRTPDPAIVTAGYTVVAKTLSKVGAADLALMAADRAWAAARRSGDPADVGMAVYQVVCALLPTSRAVLAEESAVDTARLLGGSADPAVASVTGALWLLGAIAAARRGDREAAERRLERAASLADRLGRAAGTSAGPRCAPRRSGRRRAVTRPLTLVVCGAPLAARTAELAEALAERWTVSTVVSDAAPTGGARCHGLPIVRVRTRSWRAPCRSTPPTRSPPGSWTRRPQGRSATRSARAFRSWRYRW
jgi:transcriptional regulator with XRE-family HTH domain